MNLVVVSSTQLGSVFIKENLVKQEVLEYPGLMITRGKLQGHKITLIEPGEGLEEVRITPEILVHDLAAHNVVSLGKARCHLNSLAPGDIVVSAEADQKLVDLALRAVEKFGPDDKSCKVVVGRVMEAPAAQAAKPSGRKVKEIHCVDPEGYTQARDWSAEKIPFVLIRTITPSDEESSDLTRFNWEMAKRNFWLVKGMLDSVKKLPAGKGSGSKTAQS
jgi:nucleoside phosphorylase